LKFSILCACRNGEKFIEEAIDSVLKQTYKNWEMIIIDDCSTDKTYERAKNKALSHDNISVEQNESRLYCANTYQKILEKATGDICGVLDGDDVLAKNAIERIIQVYNNNKKISWIYTQSYWCNGDLKPRRQGLSRLPLKGELLFMGKRMKHCFSHWRTFKTELREQRVPLFEKDLKCAVDKSLGYTLEELAPGGFLNECLYYYRYHKENMSHQTPQRSVWRKIVDRTVARRAKRNITAKGVRQVK